MEEEKIIFTMEDLKNNIDILIEHEKTNMKLINQIALDFATKGLDMSIPKGLFADKIETKDLKEEELLALNISIYNYFMDEYDEIKKNKDYIKVLKPRCYWYSAKISQNNLLQPEIKNKVDEWITLDEATKISDNEWQTYFTPKMIEYIIDNRKYRYNKEIQRASKIITTPSGEQIRKENVNKDGIKDLSKRYEKEDIATTQIAFALLKVKGKNGEYEFIPKYKHTGVFRFKPVFDMNRDDYFEFDINDGYHRWISKYNAIKRKSDIKNGLSVIIRIIDIPTAKQITVDSFKQNSTDHTYKQNIENNIENNIINSIIDNCSYFKGKIALSNAEEKIENMHGSFKDMKSCIPYMNLDLSNKTKCIITATDTGKYINKLIEYMIKEYYDNDVDKLKEDNLLNKNMSIGYMAIGNNLKNYDEISIGMMADIIYNNKDEINKLINTCDFKKIYDYFLNISNGVKE